MDWTVKQLDIFLKRLRRKNPDIKYVWVRERHQGKRGQGQNYQAVHFHILFNQEYKKKDIIKTWDWSNEKALDIKDINHVDNLGAYLVAYLTDDIDRDKDKSKKIYGRSLNLKKPIIIDNPDDEELQNLIPKKDSIYENQVYNEYLGVVKTVKYNRLR